MRLEVVLFALSALFVSPGPRPPRPAAGGWTTGSTGALGDVVYGPGEHVVDLAASGTYDATHWRVVLDYQSLTVQAGATVRFANHPSRAPVVMRAIGAVVIDGALVLDGEDGHAWNERPRFGEPGPGGARGGTGRVNTPLAVESAGHGAGGGFLDDGLASYHGGSASHVTRGDTGGSMNAAPGPMYTTADALVRGGSGGAGGAGASGGGGGGAGGGALLLGSDTAILVSGSISARGGEGGAGWKGGGGSGGAIRLASPIVVQTGGLLDARGNSVAPLGGDGRVRIESESEAEGIAAAPEAILAPLGEFLPVSTPTVTLASWWHAGSGTWIPIGQDPRAEIGGGPTDVEMPSSGVQLFKLEARELPLGAALQVRITSTRGDALDLEEHASGPLVGTPITVGQSTGPNGQPSTRALAWTDVEIDVGSGLSTVQVRAELP